MERCESSGGRGRVEGFLDHHRGRGRVEGFFARAFVRGDVDPHCSGLVAREADCGAIVIEVRASALFVSLNAWGDGSMMLMCVK